MTTRGSICIASLFGICGLTMGLASAQAQVLVYDQTHDGTSSDDESRPTAPSVGVGEPAVVSAGTRYLGLYSKGGGPLDFATVGGMNFPFDRTATEGRVLIDPRAEHDPIHNRLWVAYLEAAVTPGTLTLDPCLNTAFLHLSVSKDVPSIGSLGTGDWWYYTGQASGGRIAFDLRTGSYNEYKDEIGLHPPIERTARMPSLGFHTPQGEADDRGGGIVVAVNGRTSLTCPVPPSPGSDAPQVNGNTFQHIYIIPYEHDDGEASILDGDQPEPVDITVIRPFINDFDSDIAPDDSIYGWVVQEPYEQTQNYIYTRNATFIISTPLPASADTVLQSIRLKGLLYDDTEPAGEEWTLQQRVVATSSKSLDDIPLGSSLRYRPTNNTGDFPTPVIDPRTPDGTWGPAAQGTYFHSAVLARDNGPQGGQLRIFAVHAVRPEFENRWVAQWYVIDPDLVDFQSTPAPSGDWKPVVVASGRLETTGDSYHPTIVVNRQGMAFITYTYSDNQTWPEIRRVMLNNSYTGISTGPTTLKTGPSLAYDENTSAFPDFNVWANTADAQADPFDPCYYWSTHTLVHDDPFFNPTPTRDVWLFRTMYNNISCGGQLGLVDMNDDGKVDAIDMAEFQRMYDSRARRVDMDGSGEVDAIDMLLYIDAFDAYTRGR